MKKFAAKCSAPACVLLDLDSHGGPDLIRFFDASGKSPAAEYFDFDFDQSIDAILHYEGAVLAREELDTNFDHRIDTWLWCSADGHVTRAERAVGRSAFVTVWETYEGGVLATAEYDTDFDHRRDRTETYRAGKLVEVVLVTAQGRSEAIELAKGPPTGPAEAPIRCESHPES